MKRSSILHGRLHVNKNRPASYYNPVERELVLGRQLSFERWALTGLRGIRLLSRPFPISLPVELWGVILWYATEPAISPHTYCDSDTYPELHFQFYKILPPDYQDWFRCRLVCRTWNEILGPYPHRTLSNRTDITSHTNTRGITSMHLKRYGILFEIPLGQYEELVSQLTVLRIQQFSGWTPPPNPRHPAGSVKFRNVRYLSISGSDTWPHFWPGLAEACPNLVSLTVQGKVYCSGTINLPHLETLSLHPVNMRQAVEVHWELPNLRHLSLYGSYYPDQLLESHGPFLYSLMIHSSHPDLSLTPIFWDRFVSLRTVGVWARSGQTLLPPSPDHPLRHLAIFIDKDEPSRIELIKESLIDFPLIRELSIQIQDIRKQERKTLQTLATVFHVSVHLLPQAEPSPPPQSTLSMIFTPIKRTLWTPLKRILWASIMWIKDSDFFENVLKVVVFILQVVAFIVILILEATFRPPIKLSEWLQGDEEALTALGAMALWAIWCCIIYFGSRWISSKF